MRFDWDRHNEGHVLRHGVRPFEVEEALADPRRVGAEGRRVERERRWAAIGSTEVGRTLLVIFTLRGSKVRVVTARPATQAEKRRYRRGRR